MQCTCDVSSSVTLDLERFQIFSATMKQQRAILFLVSGYPIPASAAFVAATKAIPKEASNVSLANSARGVSNKIPVQVCDRDRAAPLAVPPS